jgi:hypothetical protein
MFDGCLSFCRFFLFFFLEPTALSSMELEKVIEISDEDLQIRESLDISQLSDLDKIRRQKPANNLVRQPR